MAKHIPPVRKRQPILGTWLTDVAGEINSRNSPVQADSVDAGGGPIYKGPEEAVVLRWAKATTNTTHTTFPTAEDSNTFVCQFLNRRWTLSDGTGENTMTDGESPVRTVLAATLFDTFVYAGMKVMLAKMGLRWFIIPPPIRVYAGKTGEEISAMSGSTPGSGDVDLYYFNSSNVLTALTDEDSSQVTVTGYNMLDETIATATWCHVKQETETGKFLIDFARCA